MISYEIITCNDEMVPDCKDPRDIERFLDNIVITQYFAIEDIEF